MASEQLHEDPVALGAAVIDRHRAIRSIMEELEAVDWYDQRVAATSDPELAAVLAHNRDEEKEHAAMTLEWLRRRDPSLDEQLRTYLFTYAPFYDTLAVNTLSSMFDLEDRKVAAIVSKMISHEELAAALDQVTATVIFRKGVELSRLQSLALTLSDKASSLIETN